VSFFREAGPHGLEP